MMKNDPFGIDRNSCMQSRIYCEEISLRIVPDPNLVSVFAVLCEENLSTNTL